MKFKKQIIVTMSCAIVLGGIFLAVSYIGNKDQSKEPKNNTATTTDSKINEAKNEDKKISDNSKDNNETALEQPDKNKSTEEKKAEKEDEKDTSMAEVKEGYYIVKANDTLYSIAKTYMPNSDPNEVVAEILTRNNMSKDDIISAGQKLILSYETSLVTGEKSEDVTSANATAHTDHIKYVVKSGDTLFSIAKECLSNMDITKGIEIIKVHNNISGDTIKVEDTLCIPNK
jgi:LysM repeat protein